MSDGALAQVRVGKGDIRFARLPALLLLDSLTVRSTFSASLAMVIGRAVFLFPVSIRAVTSSFPLALRCNFSRAMPGMSVDAARVRAELGFLDGHRCRLARRPGARFEGQCGGDRRDDVVGFRRLVRIGGQRSARCDHLLRNCVERAGSDPGLVDIVEVQDNCSSPGATFLIATA